MRLLESILRCPSCGSLLHCCDAGWRCEGEDIMFPREGSIPNFLLPWRRPFIDKYLTAYRRVRHAEGWGSNDLTYYLNLPYRDSTRRYTGVWRLRAKTYATLLHRIRQLHGDGKLDILDLGAGNCWLSLRLAQLGHSVVAVDINSDPCDGLGVCLRISPPKYSLQPIVAEFDHLPFAQSSFDAIIFNASLHHSSQPLASMRRALSLVRRGGAVYVADSPIYRDHGSGLQMVAERRAFFARQFNVALEEDEAGSFLTYAMLDSLRRNSDVAVETPRYGVRWSLRPVISSLLGRREPASFAVVSVSPRSDWQPHGEPEITS